MVIPDLPHLEKGADHIDVKSFQGPGSLREFIAGMLGYSPVWLKGLYGVRGIVARLLGLEHDAGSGKPLTAAELDFTPGGAVRFFTTLAGVEDRYWVGEASDKHLAAHICVWVQPGPGGANRFYVETIVHYRHWTGPVYFNLIRPFHHLVVYYIGPGRCPAARLMVFFWPPSASRAHDRFSRARLAWQVRCGLTKTWQIQK